MMYTLTWRVNNNSEFPGKSAKSDLTTPPASRLALLRAEREDKMFPDEVDTPIDTLAKIRFQK